MKNTLAAIWRPVKGLWVMDLSPNLFLFQFYHELDMERVMKNGPWTFDQQLLVFSKIETDMNPYQISLTYVEFWVQIYDLPVGYMSEHVAKTIGNFIGRFIEADPNNFKGVWRDYMRIRVSFDTTKSLKRRMRIKKVDEAVLWANFKYEKLPNFCYFCGIIGHSERFCEKFFDYPDKYVEKLFGVWLRAPNRRNMYTSGERWLRGGPMGTTAGGGDEDKMALDKEADRSTASTSSHGMQISSNERDYRDNCSNKDFQSCSEGGRLGFELNARDVSTTIDTNGPDIVTIVDPKRRRMEDGLNDNVEQQMGGPELGLNKNVQS
ncbi:hypothetical protein LguiB_003862 [Lonicera macranthoides]